jgi:hypothetical protein
MGFSGYPPSEKGERDDGGQGTHILAPASVRFVVLRETAVRSYLLKKGGESGPVYRALRVVPIFNVKYRVHWDQMLWLRHLIVIETWGTQKLVAQHVLVQSPIIIISI